MALLKKYILLEHVRPLALGLGVFIFVLFMGNIGDLIRMIAAGTGEIPAVFAILKNIILYAASFSIPMACLLACLLALGRFNSDNEITAVRASGINPSALMLPVIFASLAVSFFSIKLNAEIVPLATTGTERLLAELARREPAMFIQERMLIEDFTGHILYVQGKRGDRLEGVQITKLREEGFPVNITSRRGEILKTGDPGSLTIRLAEGTVDEADSRDPSTYSRSEFSEYYITLALPVQQTGAVRRRPKDLTVSELRDKAREMVSLNMDASTMQTEIQRKFAQSFAPAAFILIAVPIALKVKRGGRSTGFGICLSVVVFYYAVFTACQALGERGIAPPPVVWGPNILLSAGGITLMFLDR